MVFGSDLANEKARLRSVREDDLPHFQHWLSVAELRYWSSVVNSPPTWDDERQWFEDAREAQDRVYWSIDSVDGRLLGEVSLNIETFHRRGALGMFIDKATWNQGYGTDVVRLVLQHAFQVMKLNRVEAYVHEANARALRCFEKCGLRKEGLLREHRQTEDGPANTIVMAILRSEWPGDQS